MSIKWNQYSPGSIGRRYGTLGDLVPSIGQIVEFGFDDSSIVTQDNPPETPTQDIDFPCKSDQT